MVVRWWIVAILRSEYLPKVRPTIQQLKVERVSVVTILSIHIDPFAFYLTNIMFTDIC